MHSTTYIKLVVFVPETHADIVRKVMGEAGAGKLGNYEHVTFSIKGVSRFIPLSGAHPAVGTVGHMTEVIEEKIETLVHRELVPQVVQAIMDVHPYEDPGIDVYPIEEFDR